MEKHTKASEAFLEALQATPEGREWWARQQAAAEAVRPAFQAIAQTWKDVNQEIAQQAQKLIEQACIEEADFDRRWAAKYGEPPPKTIEDLERWVTRLAEKGYVPAEWVQTLEFHPRDVMPKIEGVLLALHDARQNDPTAKAKGRKRGRTSNPNRDKNIRDAYEKALENGEVESQAEFARREKIKPSTLNRIIKRVEKAETATKR